MTAKKRPARRTTWCSARSPRKPRTLPVSLATVRHLDQPPTFEKPKRIHPRRKKPLVVEGEESERHSDSFPAMLLAPSAHALSPVRILRNVELDGPRANRTASNVGEPSVAQSGDTILYTGNWYAAASLDSGATFKYIDPAKAFRAFDPPGRSFCCDQVASYIPQIDTFVWLLQYGPDQDNLQRLAFATTENVARRKWRLFDITTRTLGVPGAFLDFPDLAVGAHALYVTTNVFLGREAGSAVVRIPLEGIAAGEPVPERFLDMSHFSFRVAQSCGSTAFFAAHQNTSHLRVFSWKENESQPTAVSVPVARYIDGDGFQSRTPDGRRWLDRADPRITGATLAKGELYFAWGVNRGSNRRPKPFVQIARIDAASMSLIENIDLFDPDSAICYAALATNRRDEVGIAYMIGGGPRFPTHVVGILGEHREHLVTAESDRGPLPDPDSHAGEWGDYLTVRRCHPQEDRFIATGYTMQGTGDGSNRDCTPRFVVFGRSPAG